MNASINTQAETSRDIRIVRGTSRHIEKKTLTIKGIESKKVTNIFDACLQAIAGTLNGKVVYIESKLLDDIKGSRLVTKTNKKLGLKANDDSEKVIVIKDAEKRVGGHIAVRVKAYSKQYSTIMDIVSSKGAFEYHFDPLCTVYDILVIDAERK